YRWFTMNAAGLDVRIDDVSEQVAAVALQGPRSRDVLEGATRGDWADLRYFGRRRAEIAGVDVHVSRTGYTGELGHEIWVDAGARGGGLGPTRGRGGGCGMRCGWRGSRTASVPPASARSTSRASRPA